MAHSKESHTKKDHLCCIFHQGDVGENVAKHFKELLLQQFGRESRIILDWNATISEDLPDTIIKNIKRSKFCLFIYSLGCDDEQFMSYWKQANALALSKKAQVISLRVKPFSMKGLCEAITTIHDPIAFNENFIADTEKWDRILEEMQDLLHPESRGADNPRVASEVTDSVDSTTQQDLNAATSSLSNLCLKDAVYETEREVLLALQKNMRPPEGDDDTDNTMKVSRDDIWKGAKEAFTRTENKFEFNAPCIVTFAGEPAIDAGGPRAEAFTLLLSHIAGSSLFRGDEHSKMLNLDEGALGEGRYKLAGQMIAYALVHLGIRPCFCSRLLYSLIVDPKNSVAPLIDDIDDPDIRAAVKKIDEAANQDDYDSATEGDWIENQISIAGCSPLTLDFGKKSQLVKGLVKFDVITRTMEPLQQFTDGLGTLGVLDAVRAYPDLMKSAFVYTPYRLTADIMIDLFKEKVFSTIPGARLRAEENAVEHWKRFLKDAEVDADTLSRLLRHVTCVDRIPVFGFNPTPLLGFTHRRDDQELISISTCAHKLCIPCVENYEKFKSLLLQLIKEELKFSEVKLDGLPY